MLPGVSGSSTGAASASFVGFLKVKRTTGRNAQRALPRLLRHAVQFHVVDEFQAVIRRALKVCKPTL